MHSPSPVQTKYSVRCKLALRSVFLHPPMGCLFPCLPIVNANQIVNRRISSSPSPCRHMHSKRRLLYMVLCLITITSTYRPSIHGNKSYRTLQSGVSAQDAPFSIQLWLYVETWCKNVNATASVFESCLEQVFCRPSATSKRSILSQDPSRTQLCAVHSSAVFGKMPSSSVKLCTCYIEISSQTTHTLHKCPSHSPAGHTSSFPFPPSLSFPPLLASVLHVQQLFPGFELAIVLQRPIWRSLMPRNRRLSSRSLHEIVER